ncbi:hypothetical protein V490_06421 [Pseudogymnoascus sp. VKM F-3557]|nr:hypothetical protein V490_06421 [Pseudogymnoascus sp. VKM F-3557]
MEGSSEKPLVETGVPLLEEEAQANAQSQALEPPRQARPPPLDLRPLEPDHMESPPLEPPPIEPRKQATAENLKSDEERFLYHSLTKEEAESMVGLSMNWALTRPNSMQSELGSLVELEGGDFLESDEERPQPTTTVREELKPPEPWRAEPSERTKGARLSLRAKMSLKRRSLSISGSGDSLKDFFPSFPTTGSIKQSLQKARNKVTGSSMSSGQATPAPGSAAPSGSFGMGGPLTMEPESTLGRDRRGKPPLERPVSDSELYAPASRVSSLGDDSRFENQRQMVNSRRKAISDSFQDRKSFLPSIPSMSGIKDKFDSLTRSADESTKGNNVLTDAENGQSSTAEATLSSDKMNSKVFDRAIKNLTGDVVIMGGYRGSILKSANPSNSPLWPPPMEVGLNIGKVDLEVGLDDEDDERMEESVYAPGMLRGLGPLDVSRRLFKRLHATENAKNGTLRVWNYGYDWRLNPHLLSRKLKEFLEGLPCNVPGKETGALVIAHSLGGLITRHVVNQRPELFSGVLYAGTPQSCINIIGPLRMGDSVGFNKRVFTAQVNFTLRTSLLLLPLNGHGHGFVDKKTREPYDVDFFNVDDWIKYRISPCTDQPLPAKNPPNPSLVNLISSSLPNLPMPGRKNPSPPPGIGMTPKTTGQGPVARAMEAVTKVTSPLRKRSKSKKQSGSSTPASSSATTPNTSMTVTIPRSDAIAYLTRMLPIIRQFKLELAHNPDLQIANKYPPLSIIYAKNTPTVCGAKVDGRDSIECADVYDHLAFASGDGVCQARDAQLPTGYRYVLNGRIRTERGHVTLLGDLEAVGRAIEALTRGRELGIGRGFGDDDVWD